jgi:DNA-binding NarL/FixJ family response regulator
MGNNTPKQIRERREKIIILLDRGYHQIDIARELGITRMTQKCGNMNREGTNYCV